MFITNQYPLFFHMDAALRCCSKMTKQRILIAFFFDINPGDRPRLVSLYNIRTKINLWPGWVSNSIATSNHTVFRPARPAIFQRTEAKSFLKKRMELVFHATSGALSGPPSIFKCRYRNPNGGLTGKRHLSMQAFPANHVWLLEDNPS